MKNTTLPLVLWVLVLVISLSLAYDIFSRKQTFEQTIALVEQSNECLRVFFGLYQQDKNKIGYFKTNWKQAKGDSLKHLQSMEYAYEKSQSLRERVDAFRQEMIGTNYTSAENRKSIFLSQNIQKLLKDSLQKYQENIITEECRDCALGSDTYSDAELDLWNLENTLPLIWNTALLSLEAKTWLLQHRVVDFHSKEYLNKEVANFPYNNGELYVKSEFRVVEEGKTYNARVFYGMSVPMLYSYLSMKTDFQKVMVNNQGEGQVLFTTWTSSYDDSGEFHKTWEGDIYIVKDFMLMDNSLLFKDTIINVEDDYMLIRESY
ncbi:MAG: hypothetical protein COZ18_10865 [Flexibacter sp. CG_4_10_14_3_um_filter_32_15]|nr:MAG: hypothetical protein COZ18_10865 [Flexibacter sp. CG_4_10_14_3_um_filter_32_15]